MQKARRSHERKRRNKISVNVDCQDIINVKVETFFALANLSRQVFSCIKFTSTFHCSSSQLNKILRKHFVVDCYHVNIDEVQLAGLIILKEKYKGRRTYANYAI